MEAHKRARDADECVGDIADTCRLRDTPAEPAAATPIHENADDSTDKHEQNEGGDGRREDGHGKSPIEAIPKRTSSEKVQEF